MNRKKQYSLGRNFVLAILMAVVVVETTSAQQNAGDKEFGLSATVFANHGTPFVGTAFAQGSIGKFLSKNRYVGIAAGPQITFGSFTAIVPLPAPTSASSTKPGTPSSFLSSASAAADSSQSSRRA